MERKPRITIKQMAAQLGVSHTTVSLALREHPSIPPTTRDRIKEHAQKVGYRPDPMLASLVAYRQRNRSEQSFKGALAWLTNYSTHDGWRKVGPVGYFTGAMRRADELGYRLDEIWLNEPGMDAKRMRQVLIARNIRGLLFPPQPVPGTKIALNIDGFAAVKFGYTLASYQLPVVMNHQFRNMMFLIEQLTRIGYRRIGLAMPVINDERVHHNYAGGFWAGTHFSGLVESSSRFLPKSMDNTAFWRWFDKHRPDVIIGEAGYAGTMLEYLREGGVDVPREVGVAVVNIPYGNTYFGGIDENHELIGASAVNLVAGMLHNNETGESTNPRHVLIDGSWRLGKSLREVKPAQASAGS